MCRLKSYNVSITTQIQDRTIKYPTVKTEENVIHESV